VFSSKSRRRRTSLGAELSDTYNKEFNRMTQTFGMTAEYARLKGEIDYNVLPNIGRVEVYK
jgi:hypothetical protein